MSEPPSRALLDTSAVLDLKKVPDERLPGAITVSMITIAELQRGMHTGTATKRVARRAYYHAIRSLIEVAPFGEEATYYFGQLCGVEVSNGRNPKARTLDLMIAATAITEGAPLLTANPRDFTAAESYIPIYPL